MSSGNILNDSSSCVATAHTPNLVHTCDPLLVESVPLSVETELPNIQTGIMARCRRYVRSLPWKSLCLQRAFLIVRVLFSSRIYLMEKPVMTKDGSESSTPENSNALASG